MTDHFAVNASEQGVIIDLDDMEDIKHPINIASQSTGALVSEALMTEAMDIVEKAF